MKTTRYKFEQTVQNATEQTKAWLTEEFKAILEADKDYTRKADYIGFSILSIDERVASIDEEIKELQAFKKQLKAAKELVLQTGAEVFREYGIERLDGAGISSITTTKATTTNKTKLVIENPQGLIDAGLYRKVVDEELVKELYNSPQYGNLIASCSRLEVESIPKPAKLKVNKRKSAANNTANAITEEVA